MRTEVFETSKCRHVGTWILSGKQIGPLFKTWTIAFQGVPYDRAQEPPGSYVASPLFDSRSRCQLIAYLYNRKIRRRSLVQFLRGLEVVRLLRQLHNLCLIRTTSRLKIPLDFVVFVDTSAGREHSSERLVVIKVTYAMQGEFF